ncbi:MAG TPA: TetR/AcrR family transcriptional regulator [Arachidicoccus sp.]|nr:TetR/AcrR family transcriptional regulator [Arachidicoccus sp.]
MGKAEETRQFILQKTAKLFNIKGYAGTSLSDITALTGLTKGSIYGNFHNKEEVMGAMYDYNVQALVAVIDKALEKHPLPLDKLQAMLTVFRQQWPNMNQAGGCPIMNAAIEADDHLHFLQKQVRHSFERWASQIASIIDAGKKQGSFQRVDSRYYAYLFIGQIEGGILLSKTFNDPHFLNQAIEHLRAVIARELVIQQPNKKQRKAPFTQLFIQFFIHNHEKSSHYRTRRNYTTRQYRNRFLGRHLAGKKRRGAHH